MHGPAATADAERIFAKLKVQRRRDRRHVIGALIVDGRRVLVFHYSHESEWMRGTIPDRFRAALHLNGVEFAALRDCTMSREQYVELMRARGVIAERAGISPWLDAPHRHQRRA